MKFSDIPGHEEAKQRLRTFADTDRIPHALLLEGPAGIGKFALARAYIQYIGCSNRHDGDSCGVCASCRQHQAMQHIDTLYSYPVVKRNSKPTISADYFSEFIEYVAESPFMDRDLWLSKLGSPNTLPQIYVEEAVEITRRFSFAGHSSKYKSVLMWQAESLHPTAANKLLKIIEEPPVDSIFVMTSDNPIGVLPTIYSRAQRITLMRHSDETVASWLVDKCGIDPQAAASAAVLAGGSLSEALRAVSCSTSADRYLEQFKTLMRQAYRRDIASLKAWSVKIAGEKRDTIVDFLEYCARMLRENFIANLGRRDLSRMSADEATFSTNFARFINERNVLPIYQAVTDAINDIRANANPKIVLFDLAITVILLLKN